MLPHDAIKQYTEDNALGRVNLSLLRPYLMQRSDWGTWSIPGLDGSSSAVTTTNGEAGDGGGKFMERFGSGRLGAMMREFEGLRIGAEDLKLPSLPSMPAMPAMPSMPTRAFGIGATSPA
jgi:exocyst complex component 5